MGKKYASIHILAEGNENIILKIKEYYKKDIFKAKKEEALNMVKDERIRWMIENLPGFSANEVLIILTEFFISIYDESISFETVEETVKMLSKTIDEPLLYFSNFDDDIYIFGGYKMGRLVSNRRLGYGLDDYGMDPKELNSAKFCNVFSTFKKEFMEHLNRIEEIVTIENEIEKCLQLPLDMRLDDAQTNNEIYIEMSHEDGVYIYKSYTNKL